MSVVGYMAVSTFLNTLDFIADDLVTLRCFGVDTFCNTSINTSSDLTDEESDKEDDFEDDDYDYEDDE